MFEIYAYGNADTLGGVFNAIAAIMGGDDYLGLVRSVALIGVLVAAFSGLFTPGRFHGWGWMIGMLILYHAVFLPRAEVVVVDRLGGQTPRVIGNVPLGVAFFGHATSRIGDVMTRWFETAFQVIPEAGAQLPEQLTYQRSGVLFGNRLIQASRAATVADPQLRLDLIAFVHNCTVYDLQDGTLDAGAFARSTDLWSAMANPNPARFTTTGNPAQVATCPEAYASLNARLPAAVASARAVLAFKLNPALQPDAALGVIDAQVEQAWLRSGIASAAQDAASLLRQNILINLVQDGVGLAGQRLGDPAAVMLATARANATASANAGFITMGRVAAQALPMIRNVIEAVVYAVFPFVFLMLLLAQGRALGMAIRSFVLSLVWIQLWPPLYAVLNYVGTLASARNLEAAARMGASAQGLALETASAIYQGAISDQAIAGYMVASIPLIASAIVKGGEVAFQAVSGAAALQSAASTEAAATTKGLVNQGGVSFEQQQLAPNRTSAFMSTTTDAWGTTIQGLGADAGVLRYQASMSRLPTTFTVTERQAAAFGDTARQAETLARSEREALASSQAATLGRAMALQSGFEQSTQRSGDTSIADSGSSATQIQRLNTVARDVNRRLGLADDSTVGKTVTAAASLGASIPFTDIGAQLNRSGQAVETEKLTSAYDFARRATQSAQIGQADSLAREFRQSDAYQWARQQRTAAADSFDSSWRETQDRQSSADLSYARAQELARTAQFMAEWSSGAQTDFTNYAAQRLAERGLLKESDPMRLQRAVTDVAMAYARGGQTRTGFISADSPFLPDRQASFDREGFDTPLPAQYRDAVVTQMDDQGLRSIATINDRLVEQRRIVWGLTDKEAVDDVTPSAQRERKAVSANIGTLRAENAERSHDMNEAWAGEANVNAISPHHGGNPAVWDTVGAAAARPEVQVPAERPIRRRP